jgi:hypothetical protein
VKDFTFQFVCKRPIADAEGLSEFSHAHPCSAIIALVVRTAEANAVRSELIIPNPSISSDS